jgi:hypothetical protein
VISPPVPLRRQAGGKPPRADLHRLRFGRDTQRATLDAAEEAPQASMISARFANAVPRR